MLKKYEDELEFDEDSQTFNHIDFNYQHLEDISDENITNLFTNIEHDCFSNNGISSHKNEQLTPLENIPHQRNQRGKECCGVEADITDETETSDSCISKRNAIPKESNRLVIIGDKIDDTCAGFSRISKSVPVQSRNQVKDKCSSSSWNIDRRNSVRNQLAKSYGDYNIDDTEAGPCSGNINRVSGQGNQVIGKCPTCDIDASHSSNCDSVHGHQDKQLTGLYTDCNFNENKSNSSSSSNSLFDQKEECFGSVNTEENTGSCSRSNIVPDQKQKCSMQNIVTEDTGSCRRKSNSVSDQEDKPTSGRNIGESTGSNSDRSDSVVDKIRFLDPGFIDFDDLRKMQEDNQWDIFYQEFSVTSKDKIFDEEMPTETKIKVEIKDEEIDDIDFANSPSLSSSSSSSSSPSSSLSSLSSDESSNSESEENEQHHVVIQQTVNQSQIITERSNARHVVNKTRSSPNNKKTSNKKKRRRRSNLMKPGSQLYQFILQLLDDDSKQELIHWEKPYSNGVFRIVNKEKVAKLWGEARNRKMSYDSLSRGLRHYYSQGLLNAVNKKLHYQFTQKALKEWEIIRDKDSIEDR